MNLIENPYESPSPSGTATEPASWTWSASVLAVVGRLGFWFGVFQILLGAIITYVPGGECGHFIAAGLFTAAGVLIPKWRYRIATLLLCLLCCYLAYAGYIHGVDYQKWLKEQGTASRSDIRHPNNDGA